jgi:hypothetical protein
LLIAVGRQAFAIGMVVAVTVYQALLVHAGMGGNFNTEFISDRAAVRLPTTQVLRTLYAVIQTADSPDGSAFMSVGHHWWALLLGYVGGRFAQHLYARRQIELSSSTS